MRSLSNLYKKPSGVYLRAFSIGEWSNLPQTYCRILDFAKENNIELTGFAFEEGINEMAINTMDEYITQILIQCNIKNAYEIIR